MSQPTVFTSEGVRQEIKRQTDVLWAEFRKECANVEVTAAIQDLKDDYQARAERIKLELNAWLKAVREAEHKAANAELHKLERKHEMDLYDLDAKQSAELLPFDEELDKAKEIAETKYVDNTKEIRNKYDALIDAANREYKTKIAELRNRGK
jgi:hypothetical protein